MFMIYCQPKQGTKRHLSYLLALLQQFAPLGLAEKAVNSKLETLASLEGGSANRATGGNAPSSRSHAICSSMIRQESKSEQKERMTAKFHPF